MQADTRKREESEAELFYNISYLAATTVRCDVCRRDITTATKALAQRRDYCCPCFANLPSFPDYRILSRLDYPLYEPAWTARHELLLLEAMERAGFANWEEIAEEMGGEKSQQQIEQHYFAVYVNSQFLPLLPPLARRDANGRLTLNPISAKRRPTHNSIPAFTDQPTVSASPLRATSGSAETVGYMSRRFEFEVEYDNDAELLLAEMEFNEDDSPQEMKAKLRVIEIYNKRLDERIRRKQFVVDARLLDPQHTQARDRDEKQLQAMMRPFARYHSPRTHQALIEGILQEKRIRHRLRDLHLLKHQENRTAHTHTPPLPQRHPKRRRTKEERQSEEESALLSRFGLSSRQYAMLKETILRECVKQGVVGKAEQPVERGAVDAMFEVQLRSSSSDSSGASE